MICCSTPKMMQALSQFHMTKTMLLVLILLLSFQICCCDRAPHNLHYGSEPQNSHFASLRKADQHGKENKDAEQDGTRIKHLMTKRSTVKPPFSVLCPLLCTARDEHKVSKSRPIANRRQPRLWRSKRQVYRMGITSNEKDKLISGQDQDNTKLSQQTRPLSLVNRQEKLATNNSNHPVLNQAGHSLRSNFVSSMSIREDETDVSKNADIENEDFKDTYDSLPPALKNMNEFVLVHDQHSSFLIYKSFSPPINHYRCGRCLCFKTAKNMVHANCKSLYRYFVPQNLPWNTIYLDLNKNYIVSLPFSNYTSYTSLRTLKVSENKIEHIKNTSCGVRLEITSLDLSHNKIQSIDAGSFACLPKLKYLYLSHNNIKILTNLTLIGLPHLKVLDLSHNTLKKIEYDAFYMCKSLRKLMLNNNKKMSYGIERFNEKIFEPLTNLQTLSVQGFGPINRNYPTEALLKLRNLRKLNIDGVSTGNFDCRLKNLTRMTSLTIGVNGGCWARNISDSYFEGFPSLISIHISNCLNGTISPHAFDGNPHLENISYTEMEYRLDEILFSLRGINHSVIKSLTLNHMFKGLKSSPCQYLSKDQAKQLRKMTNLEELRLENNQISIIDYSFIISLPKSLKTISVRKNMLYYRRSILMFSKYVYSLSNLTHLHEDMQNQVTYFEANEQPTVGVIKQHCQIDSESCKDRTSPSLSIETSNEIFLNDVESTRNLSSNIVGYDLPLNLQVYTATQSFYFGQSITSRRLTKNKLRFYNISDSYTKNWGSRYLSPEIQYADLSNNPCVFLSNHFFHINNSLEQLHLQGNFLGDDFATDWKGEKLARLRKVRYIDISRNHIQTIPKNFFSGLVNVEVLKLSINNIQLFNITASHMVNLRFIDLSKNSISWISKHTRDDLDNIASFKHPVYIDLTFNLLPCTCQGIELLLWMAKSNVRLVNKDFLRCVDSHNNKQWMGDLNKRVTDLQRYCASKAYLVLISAFSVGFVILLMVAVWVFRNRWWLYYIKNITITKFYGFKVRDNENERVNYAFDAYIIYSSHDLGFIKNECVKELEEIRGHRLCLEDRDFLGGTFAPCNITSAIKNSRVTIPVITCNFGKGEWTEYSLQMAIMESLYSKRDIIHLLVYEPSAVKDMPRYIIKLHNENAFSEYPPRDCAVEVKTAFWDAVSHAIRNATNAEVRPGQDLL